MADTLKIHHTKIILQKLSTPSFAFNFHDVTLVFEDGQRVPYYKSLLSLLSMEWKLLLQISSESEVVILPETKVEQVFRVVGKNIQPEETKQKIKDVGNEDLSINSKITEKVSLESKQFEKDFSGEVSRGKNKDGYIDETFENVNLKLKEESNEEADSFFNQSDNYLNSHSKYDPGSSFDKVKIKEHSISDFEENFTSKIWKEDLKPCRKFQTKYSCNECDYITEKDAWNLKRHKILSHQSGLNMFKCNRYFCEERFLTRHMKAIHMKQCFKLCPRPGCEDRKFIWREKVESHARTHVPKDKSQVDWHL